MSGIFTVIGTDQNQLDTLMQTVTNARNLKADSILLENSQWQTNEVYESKLKQLNAIYLSTFAKGIDTLDAGQLSTVATIANQCPATGGYGVYQARSMHTLFADDDYDDTQLCSGGALARQDDLAERERKYAGLAKPKGFSLFPNPADQEVQLTYQLGQNDAILEITDLWGRVVVGNLTLHAGDDQVFIDTAHLPKGVYVVKIVRQKEILYTERLIIQ